MADIYVVPGGSYETSIDWGVTGLTGTIGVRLLDGAGGTTVARVTAGISEFPATSGLYIITRTAPSTAGDYDEWWDNGVLTVGNNALGDRIIVTSTTPSASVPAGTDLATVGAAREFVLRDAADTSQDSQLTRLIHAYSVAVTQYTRREWVPTVTATRKFQYDGSGYLSLDPYDLRTLTSIVMYSDLPTVDQRTLVAGTSAVEGEYRLLPPNLTGESTYLAIELPQAGRLGGISSIFNNPYPYGPVGLSSPAYFEVAVNGAWGIGTIPADVELAVLIAVDDAYKNPTAFAGGNVGGLEFTELVDTSASGFRARNLPVESRGLLTPYRRGTDIVVA